MFAALTNTTRNAIFAIIASFIYYYYHLSTFNSSNHLGPKNILLLRSATNITSLWLASLLNCAKHCNILRPLSGAIGSALSITVVYPLETVRTRLQVGIAGCDATDKNLGAHSKSNNGKESRMFHDAIRNYFTSSSFLHRIYRIYTTEGVVNGLYKGWYSLVVTTMILNFVYFYWFHWLRNLVWMRSISDYFVQMNDEAIRSEAVDDHNVILDLTAGYLAGVIAVLVTGPLWLVNTRLKLQGVDNHSCEGSTNKGGSDENCKSKSGSGNQRTDEDREVCRSDNGAKSEKHSATNHKYKYNGISQTLFTISKEEGILSLWNGTSASVILSFNPAIQFGVYEMLKRQSGSDGGNTFVNAVIAKFVATLVTYPMQVIQTQHRAGHHVATRSESNSPLFHWIHDIWRIIRNDGVVSGLYCGFETKLVQGCINSAVMFVVYEHLILYLSRWLTP